MLSASEVEKMLPLIGPEVSGGSFCPLDGHVNSLRTFRAFHTGLKLFGVDYFPERPVSAIARSGGEFRLSTPQGEIRAGKVVLAAGNANQSLAPMVGLSAPMGPTRGQIVVTERTMPFLPHPLTTIRQTDEGTVMIGDSKEEQLDDRTLNHSVSAVMADRAQRMFPHLARLNVVRTWSGIRVMPQDGFPIYDQSETRAGRFRHLLSFRCDARLQPRFRYCPDGGGGRARTGTRRRVLGPPLRREPCCDRQRILLTSTRPERARKRRRGIQCSNDPIRTAEDPCTSSWTGPPSRRARAIRFPLRCSPPAVDVRRATAVSGAPRLPYCMMGVCFDCLVTIDGVGNRQGCLVPVRRGHAD